MRALQRSIRPGEWLMVDRGRKIAVLLQLEIGPRRQKLIRSVTWAPASEDRVLIGYFPDLEMAAYVTWREWVRATTERPAQSGD